MTAAKPNFTVCEHITDCNWTKPQWMSLLQPWPHTAVHNSYCITCFNEVVAKRYTALVGYEIDRCDFCFRDVQPIPLWRPSPDQASSGDPRTWHAPSPKPSRSIQHLRQRRCLRCA